MCATATAVAAMQLAQTSPSSSSATSSSSSSSSHAMSSNPSPVPQGQPAVLALAVRDSALRVLGKSIQESDAPSMRQIVRDQPIRPPSYTPAPALVPLKPQSFAPGHIPQGATLQSLYMIQAQAQGQGQGQGHSQEQHRPAIPQPPVVSGISTDRNVFGAAQGNGPGTTHVTNTAGVNGAAVPPASLLSILGFSPDRLPPSSSTPNPAAASLSSSLSAVQAPVKEEWCGWGCEQDALALFAVYQYGWPSGDRRTQHWEHFFRHNNFSLDARATQDGCTRTAPEDKGIANSISTESTGLKEGLTRGEEKGSPCLPIHPGLLHSRIFLKRARDLGFALRQTSEDKKVPDALPTNHRAKPKVVINLNAIALRTVVRWGWPRKHYRDLEEIVKKEKMAVDSEIDCGLTGVKEECKSKYLLTWEGFTQLCRTGDIAFNEGDTDIPLSVAAVERIVDAMAAVREAALNKVIGTEPPTIEGQPSRIAVLPLHRLHSHLPVELRRRRK